MSQLSFATLDYAAKKKRTKRDVFLAETMEVVPWAELEAAIAPHYPKAGPNGGRRPYSLGVMLRIYCLQQWYQLSDPGAEEALYDICSMRTFAGLELGRDAIPDETTILNFRHLLERHDLTKAVFAAVAGHLETRGALLRGGTIVDATLIAASPSTKNHAGKRDTEMAGVYWAVKDQRKPGRQLSASQKKRNLKHGAVRAKVEHVFRVLKCQFGYRRVRYRGIAKNAAQVVSLLALANLYRARRTLLAA